MTQVQGPATLHDENPPKPTARQPAREAVAVRHDRPRSLGTKRAMESMIEDSQEWCPSARRSSIAAATRRSIMSSRFSRSRELPRARVDPAYDLSSLVDFTRVAICPDYARGTYPGCMRRAVSETARSRAS